MRAHFVPSSALFLPLLLLSACPSSTSTDGPCTDVVCTTAPADTCIDANTLLTYVESGTCDEVDGTCSYASTEEACPFGCVADACAPAPEGLQLVVPQEAALCSYWGWGGDSVQMNWEGKARITLNPGTIVFPEGADTVAADPIASVVAWPGVTASPTTQGAFTRTIEDQGDGIERHRYELSQDFEVDGRNLDVLLQFDYLFENGEPLDGVITLDDPTVFNADTGYRGTFFESWFQIPLIGCNFEHLDERVRTINVDNGDRITFTERGKNGGLPWPIGDLGWDFELVEARIERGPETRVVTDYFDLASTTNHHRCCPSYLARLDPPLDDVHQVWIDEFSYGDNVQYVDSNGQQLASEPFVDAP